MLFRNLKLLYLKLGENVLFFKSAISMSSLILPFGDKFPSRYFIIIWDSNIQNCSVLLLPGVASGKTNWGQGITNNWCIYDFDPRRKHTFHNFRSENRGSSSYSLTTAVLIKVMKRLPRSPSQSTRIVSVSTGLSIGSTLQLMRLWSKELRESL